MNSKQTVRIKILSTIKKHIKLRTYIAAGLIIILAPLAFAAAYGILGALGGSTALPIAHWAFDEGVDDTCPGGSNDACDSTGNGNDGEISGASWQSEDKCVSGKCLYFDGTDDTVTLPTNMLDSYSTGSVCTWFKWTVPSDVGNEYHMFSYADSAGTQNKANFYVSDVGTDNGNLVFFLRRNTGNDVTIKTGAQAVRRNSWQHACVTQSGSGLALYLDGELAATTTTTNGTGTANDWFATIAAGAENASISGTADDTPGQFFQGFMDEVKVFDSALSAAQVKAEYAGGAAVLGAQNTDFLNEGLVGYWPMDESAGNTCSEGSNDSCDKSGGGNDGAWNGDTTSAGGKFGNGTIYDGSGDYTSVGLTSLGASAGTFAFWINPSSISSDDAFFGASQGTNSLFGSINSSGEISFRTSSASTFDTLTTTGASVATGAWTHVVLTIDDSGRKIFKNGTQIAQDSSTLWTSTISNLTFGMRTGSSLPFTGSIDEVRIYNRALSPSEVQSLYNWAPGPVGYWTFDEGSGTGSEAVKDRSGNGHNGNMEASMTDSDWVPGRYGSALELDGADDYISVEDPEDGILDFGVSKDFTLMAWVKTTSATTQSIIEKQDTARWLLRLESTGVVHAYVSDGTNQGASDSTVTVNDGGWHHVVAVFDRDGHVAVYVDGVLSGTPDSISDIEDIDIEANVYFGSQQGTTNRFNGALDEIKIYNYARTAQQIIEDMNGGHPTGSPIGSPLAYWKLDEMSGDTAYDSVGSNNGDLGNSDTSCPTSGADCPTWTASGKFNGALNFDGDDLAVFSAIPTVTVSGNYSISLWFYTSTTSGNQTLINFSNGTSDRHGINLEDSTIRGGYYNGSSYVGKSGAFSANQWNHVVLINNSGTVSLYLNGTPLTGTSLASLATNSPANTLGFSSNGNIYFTGMIDEVKVYASALTPEQVKLDMNKGASINFGSGTDETEDIVDGSINPPVGYWTFDEKVSGDSQTILNKSGNANGTTVDGDNDTGMDCSVRGKYGSACQFDGVDDYLDLGDIPHSNEITWSFWINPSTLSTTQRILDKFNTSGSNREWSIYLDSSNNLVLQASSDGSDNESQTASTNSLTANQWTHFAVIYDNGVFDVYQNGRLLSDDGDFSTVTSIADTSTSIRAGEGYVSAPYSGLLDEVKIYNQALTAAQVAYEYNRGEPVVWLKFDDNVSGNGETLKNSAGDSFAATTSDGANDTGMDCTVNGKYNLACEFDGDDDTASISGFNFGTGDFTVAAWINSTSSDASLGIIAYEGTARMRFMMSSAVSHRLNYGIYSDGEWVSRLEFGYDLTDDTWHHVAVTFDRDGDATAYVDGKRTQALDISSKSSADISSGTLRIGYDSFSAGSYFEGRIDDVRIYNYVLSENQVKKIMTSGPRGSGASFQ